jgi:endoplasmic reticulum protein 29
MDELTASPSRVHSIAYTRSRTHGRAPRRCDQVAATHDVLVRFDRQHAYGDKEDVFKDLALKLRELETPETFLLAYVGVQEYQDKLNKAMAEERFGVSKADWPAYKLLLRSQPDAPLDYDGPVTVDALLSFLAEKAGLATAAGRSEL